MIDDEREESGLPPLVAARLDQLLSAWGQQRQLDAGVAAAIREAVLAEAEEPAARWWQVHRAQVNALVSQARQLAHELASAGLAQANAQRGNRWAAGQWTGMAWRQAYVRLG